MYVYEYELMYKCPHKHTLLIYGMILPTSRVKQGYSRKGNVHGMFFISNLCCNRKWKPKKNQW